MLPGWRAAGAVRVQPAAKAQPGQPDILPLGVIVPV